MNDFDIIKMLQVLYDAVDGISQNRFLSERPKIENDKMDNFVVVALPGTILKPVIGNGYGSSYSICRIELYARNIASGMNIRKLDEMLKAVTALFPISQNGVSVKNPKVVMRGSDDNDFHVILINADISISN